MRLLKLVLLVFLTFGSNILSGQCHYPINDEIPDGYAEISFVSKNTGWRIFTDGQLYRTDDGGDTWNLLSDLTSESFSPRMKFISVDTGFITTTQDFYWTTDGGFNWNSNKNGKYREIVYDGNGGLYFQQNDGFLYSNDFFESFTFTPTNDRIVTFTFYQNGKGFILLRDGAIFHINNGNLENSARFQNPDLNAQCIHFFDESEGILLDDSFNLFRSLDSGITWNFEQQIADSLNLSSGRSNFVFIPGSGIGGIRLSPLRYEIKTFDKGETWSFKSVNPIIIYPFEACKDSTFWFHKGWEYSYKGNSAFQRDDLITYKYAGAINEIQAFTDSIWLIRGSNEFLITDDAGKTIRLLESSLPVNPRTFSLYDHSSGFSLSNTGVLFKTSDRGESWEQIYDFEQNNMSALKFYNENEGFVVDLTTKLLKTSDGGHTWQELTGLPDFKGRFQFYKSNRISFIGDQKLYTSIDAGHSWEEHDLEWPFAKGLHTWKNDSTLFLVFDKKGVYEYDLTRKDTSLAFTIDNNVSVILWDTKNIYLEGPSGELYVSIGGNSPIALVNHSKASRFNLQYLFNSPQNEVIIGAYDGYLGKLNNEPLTCNINFTTYANDSIFDKDIPIEWISNNPCINNYIIAAGSQPDLNDLLEQQIIGSINSINPKPEFNQFHDLYVKIGIVSPEDTLFCLEKHLINPRCELEIPLEFSYCQSRPTFRGRTYPSGQHQVHVNGIGECDTLFHLTVRRIVLKEEFSFLPFCKGGSINHNGTIFTSSTFFEEITKAREGCDSIRTTTTIFENPSHSNYLEIYNPVPDKLIENLFFLNDTIGWSGERFNGKLSLSHDGGKSWATIYDFGTKDIWHIQFITELIGWVLLSDKSIGKTTDGGFSWTFYSFNLNHTPKKFEFISESDGYLVGYDGLVAKTENSGETWSQLAIPVNNTLNGSHFFDKDTGFIFGQNGTLLFTENGGLNWESKILYLNPVNGISFLNRDTGLLLLNHAILITFNGGNDWDPMISLQTSANNFATFVEPNEIVVRQNRNLLISSDFNMTWDTVILATRLNQSAFFSKPELGFWLGFEENVLFNYKRKAINCINDLTNPNANQSHISIFQTFAWSSIYPCVEGYEISLGSGTSTNNLDNLRDIGGREFYKNAFPLPFDSDINLSIFPYLEDNQNNTCPPLSFRTCPFIGDSIKVEICEGDVFEFRGNQYTEDTKTYWSWSLPGGCDSFIVLDLKVIPVEQILVDTTFDKGDTFLGITLQNDTTIYRTYTNSLGCDSFVVYTIMVDKSGTAEPYSFTGIRVFPNPTSGKLLVSMAEIPEGIVRSEMYNSTGQLVHRDNLYRRPNNIFELDIPPSLTDGIYILKILFEKGSYVEKISLKRP